MVGAESEIIPLLQGVLSSGEPYRRIVEWYQVSCFPTPTRRLARSVSSSTSPTSPASSRARVPCTESEELYRSILRASPDDITVTDLEGRIQLVSPAAVSMLGHESEEEMLGRPMLDYLAPEDRQRAEANLGLMFDGVYTGPAEYTAVRTDETRFPIEVNGEFTRDALGRPTAWSSSSATSRSASWPSRRCARAKSDSGSCSRITARSCCSWSPTAGRSSTSTRRPSGSTGTRASSCGRCASTRSTSSRPRRSPLGAAGRSIKSKTCSPFPTGWPAARSASWRCTPRR